MTDTLVSQIRKIIPSANIKAAEPLAAHTSFKIGGPASLMIFPKTAEELAEQCKALFILGEKPIILGNGSNVLAPDEGLDRIVIITSGICGISIRDREITAECGVPLTKLAATASAEGLSGLEFAYGIPGTVGGALVMNAGAYGGEIKDVVYKTEFVKASGGIRTITGGEHGFGYRTSAFGAEDIILRTVIRLSKGSAEEIKSRMETLMAKRRASQPLELPSAGSAFKRPEGGYAADLIDRAGLKGCAYGGARVSEKHAGFIVNTGGATCGDVKRLIEHIQRTVYSKFGIELQTEIKMLG